MRHAVVVISVLASAAPLGATVAASPPRGTDVVPCSVAIKQTRHARLTSGDRLVLGRITVPQRIVQLDRAAPGWDRFAKAGIDVRAGTPVVLEVPKAWRRVYALEYAPGPHEVMRVGDGSVRVSVHSCAGLLGAWNAYAGGYVVRRPQCVPLIVRAGGKSARVHIAIGRKCTSRPHAGPTTTQTAGG
jgi:hypothetical protein